MRVLQLHSMLCVECVVNIHEIGGRVGEDVEQWEAFHFPFAASRCKRDGIQCNVQLPTM